MTAQNKLSALIIGVLPIAIALFLSVSNPDYIGPLFNETLGQLLVILALTMMGIGAFLLKRVTTLEV